MPLPVPSHSVEFKAADLLRRLAAPALGVVVAAALVHVASLGGLLPASAPADLDRTVLAAKADLASRSAPASIVLVGDSSCMMDVDAPALGRHLGQTVLNLGTLSYLDLAAHGMLLSHALRHASEPPREVVLLLHPGSLLRASSEPGLEHFLGERLRLGSADPTSPIPPFRSGFTSGLLGGDIVRGQMVQPWFPSLLRGEFGAAYGTTWQIHRLLMRQSGTLLDPTPFDPLANAGRYEFHLNPALEKVSREFRSLIPAGCRFSVGLTPLPESLALDRHADRVASTLGVWASWLQPDRVLAGLPAVLPDALFASAAHLNAEGTAEFTRRLSAELAR